MPAGLPRIVAHSTCHALLACNLMSASASQQSWRPPEAWDGPRWVLQVQLQWPAAWLCRQQQAAAAAGSRCCTAQEQCALLLGSATSCANPGREAGRPAEQARRAACSCDSPQPLPRRQPNRQACSAARIPASTPPSRVRARPGRTGWCAWKALPGLPAVGRGAAPWPPSAVVPPPAHRPSLGRQSCGKS